MNDLNHLILSENSLIFNSENGDIYQVNEVANLIIKSLRSCESTDKIAQTISSIYSLPYEQALTDILEFQNHLSTIGILR